MSDDFDDAMTPRERRSAFVSDLVVCAAGAVAIEVLGRLLA